MPFTMRYINHAPIYEWMDGAHHPSNLDNCPVARYTQSQCWALALELNAMTGFPFVFISNYNSGEDQPIEPASWAHAFIETPWGTWIDIEGEWDPDEASAHYAEVEDQDIYETRNQDVITDSEWGIQYDSELDFKVAAHIVKELGLPVDKEPVMV